MCVLNYKPCHIPLKYRHLDKTSFQCRHAYLRMVMNMSTLLSTSMYNVCFFLNIKILIFSRALWNVWVLYVLCYSSVWPYCGHLPLEIMIQCWLLDCLKWLAVVNLADCDFKNLDWNRVAKIIRSRSEDLLSDYVITYALPIVLTNKPRLVSMLST